MSSTLFLLQRMTAAILAVAVCVHLVTIFYAVHSGLTAGQILSRTEGNVLFFVFYLIFVVAAAIHAPIGLKNVLAEWLGWRGSSCDAALIAFAFLLIVLGSRAAWAVFQ